MIQDAKNTNNKSKYEWACRILLTIAFLRGISGYVVFLQTKYQITTPLIPESVTYEISNPYIVASVSSGMLAIAGLWFYFLNKKLLCLIISCIAVIMFEVSWQFMIN